ncbi:syntaxin putative [Entamoeba histolytica]|uniref:Syntaxin, putative n=2 Tax=Entamoeba histolytica TaxID=5759 RepID=C4LT43_ENTH1|nr:syntaxin, putative [Entamoeba histolytica HM-1:IMSS]EAL52135.1 syntaxin, putative [Entamoeba histolytica HM-1:IMSS]GAT91714.1 syntaxin putative [Entamoeba histolytica]|eukprot:XP_657465.1 syntaxin, putative [Entamoeba histolytica HM-1:IMSS]
MNIIGFTKDWTTEFYDQRSNFLGGTIVENSVQTVTISEPLTWAQTADEIKNKSKDIVYKINDLSRLQKKYLSIDLDDYESIGKEVDMKTNEIKLNLKQLQNEVIKFNRFKEEDNPTLIQNVQTNLAEEVNKVAEQFKSQNKSYLLKLKQRTKKFDDCFTTEGEEGVYSFGFDEKQLNMLSESEEMVDQRVAEIKKIAKTVQELAEMTQQLNMLIHEQGTIIDRIDYNIDHTEHQVSKAVEEIKQAETYQKATRVKIIVLILLILILGAIIVLVLKVAL